MLDTDSDGFCKAKLFFLAGIYVNQSTNSKLAGSTNKGKGGGSKEATTNWPAQTPAVAVATAEGSLPLYSFSGNHIMVDQYFLIVFVFGYLKLKIYVL